MYNDNKIISIIELYLIDKLYSPLIDIMFASLENIASDKKSYWHWYLNNGRMGFAISPWILNKKNPDNWQKIMDYKK
jgi:hypothetical protein